MSYDNISAGALSKPGVRASGIALSPLWWTYFHKEVRCKKQGKLCHTCFDEKSVGAVDLFGVLKRGSRGNGVGSTIPRLA